MRRKIGQWRQGWKTDNTLNNFSCSDDSSKKMIFKKLLTGQNPGTMIILIIVTPINLGYSGTYSTKVWSKLSVEKNLLIKSVLLKMFMLIDRGKWISGGGFKSMVKYFDEIELNDGRQHKAKIKKFIDFFVKSWWKLWQ